MPIKELTAKRDRCGASLTCPAVFDDNSNLLIIGAKRSHQEIDSRVGAHEVIIEIDRGLVTRALAGPVSRILMRVGL
jgi:hypothetical protein